MILRKRKKSKIKLENTVFSDKAHNMNLLDYKMASLIFYSQNKEELHEIVQTHINTLSYNAAWDFKITEDTEGLEYKVILSFKYNGTILACNAIGKLHFGYSYRREAKWRNN